MKFRGIHETKITGRRGTFWLFAEKYCASFTDIKAKNKTHRKSFQRGHKKLCKNQVDREKICPRNGSPTNHSRFILDVDTPRGGYSIEKVSCHKRYINSTQLYLLDLRK
jgi:hypothetical protein